MKISFNKTFSFKCLGFVWIYSTKQCCAKEEIRVFAGLEYARDTSIFDSKIETELTVDNALRSLINLIASRRLKFFGDDTSPGNLAGQVLTPSRCEKLVATVIHKLTTPEQLVSFGAICRTKSALYGRS